MDKHNQNRTNSLHNFQSGNQTTLDPLWRLPRIDLGKKAKSNTKQKETKSGHSPEQILRIPTLDEIYNDPTSFVENFTYPLQSKENNCKSNAWSCHSPCSLCSESSTPSSPFNLTLRSGIQIRPKKVCSRTPVFVFTMSVLILLGIIGAILYMKLVVGS